ncbi:MAG: hypothetical protein RLZZ01_1832, partial [Actinomycetota bacterium]
FCDADRSVVRALGLTQLPAFAFIRVDGEAVARAEGWNPAEWRAVADAITETTKWRSPMIPGPGDPGPFSGSAAAG